MPLATTFCTQAEMTRYFSAAGLVAFSDHDADQEADDDVIDDCINQATEEISMYAAQWYAIADLATSTLVNRWATTLAVYFLCLRRGNPAPESLQREFDRIMAKLAEILAGTLKLPDVAMRDDMRPSMSNLRVDRRYSQSRIRVTPANSTDAPTRLTQDQIPYPPMIYE